MKIRKIFHSTCRKRSLSQLIGTIIIVLAIMMVLGTGGLLFLRPETFFCLAGFPGVSDFAFDVADGYQLARTSAHSVMITPKRVGVYGKDNIPAEVVRLAWNERFVLAERKPVRGEDTEVLDYWLIDARHEKVYGPFDVPTFERQRMALGVPDSLVLKPVSSYLSWWECFKPLSER